MESDLQPPPRSSPSPPLKTRLWRWERQTVSVRSDDDGNLQISNSSKIALIENGGSRRVENAFDFETASSERSRGGCFVGRERTREGQRERSDANDESCVKPELRGTGDGGLSGGQSWCANFENSRQVGDIFCTFRVGTGRTCFHASSRLTEACASMEGTSVSGFSSTTPSTPSDARMETRRLVCRRPRPTTRVGEAACLTSSATRAPAPARGRTALTRAADVTPKMVPSSIVAMLTCVSTVCRETSRATTNDAPPRDKSTRIREDSQGAFTIHGSSPMDGQSETIAWIWRERGEAAIAVAARVLV